jgi:hypothetical protein
MDGVSKLLEAFNKRVSVEDKPVIPPLAIV